MKRFIALPLIAVSALSGCGDASRTSDTHSNPKTVNTVSAATQETPDATETESSTTPSADAASETASESVPKKSLVDAAAGGDAEAVRQHIEAGTDLNQQNPQGGATPLIAAAAMGQTETSLMLIEAGADLEIKDHQGATALHTAAFLCREEIVKALLAKGADKDAKNHGGATALESVAGPFEEVKPVYDLLLALLGPHGLELDYDFIRATRPKIAELLQAP